MSSYLKDRPSITGPLFCHFEGTPLSKYQFSALLKKALLFLRIDQSGFKSHSFRIGMATTCSLEGMSDQQIKLRGRWKSAAYTRYIRI